MHDPVMFILQALVSFASAVALVVRHPASFQVPDYDFLRAFK
ncbi:hypothetical protein ACPOL_4595 [Acidisarcina polymorpha]|uniref:Uncharacterized protein n=1 Tax=Acidisarcina polymorpha TaxID=2211140 RepID=A0A2Z5G524_9BACT|nr:hypothetical protein ACPOL_4595 [Acidisarcina polymorpha]